MFFLTFIDSSRIWVYLHCLCSVLYILPNNSALCYELLFLSNILTLKGREQGSLLLMMHLLFCKASVASFLRGSNSSLA